MSVPWNQHLLFGAVVIHGYGSGSIPIGYFDFAPSNSRLSGLFYVSYLKTSVSGDIGFDIGIGIPRKEGKITLTEELFRRGLEDVVSRRLVDEEGWKFEIQRES